QVLREFGEKMPQWVKTTLPLDAYAGKRILLTFHFQTSVGRLTSQRTDAGSRLTCVPTTNEDTETNLLCLGRPVDQWVLDNVRVFGERGGDKVAIPGGFLDTAGDGGSDVWEGWSKAANLRTLADRNVVLPRECLTGLEPVAPPSTPAPPSPDSLLACIDGSGLTGPSVTVDGRGWRRFVHGAPASNGVPNPYYDGWFLDESSGFQAPGRESAVAGYALRWGGPGSGGVAPEFRHYGVASSPLIDLSRSALPSVGFQANYSILREFKVSNETHKGIHDGATVYLARYVCDPAVTSGCTRILDRRTILLPEGGYPGFVNPVMASSDNLGIDCRTDADDNEFCWSAYRGGLVPVPTNAFSGRSGPDPLAAQWVTQRFDLLQGIDALCLKRLSKEGLSEVRSFDPQMCEEKRRDKNLTWVDGVAEDPQTGVRYQNLSSYGEDAGALYAIEFHATQGQEKSAFVPTVSDYGLAVDDFRAGERVLANDLGISRVVVPREGQVVGPGEEVQVRVNVTNFGYFTQRGVELH
ncbi:MAG: hypothetical protein ACRDHK_10120, partial [Actinomycetota bacterium]